MDRSQGQQLRTMILRERCSFRIFWGGRIVKLRIEKQQINGWLRAKKGLAEFGDHKLLVAAIHTFVKFLKISFCVTQGSS